MSMDGYLGGEHFPADAANLITLDWATEAYANHTLVRGDIAAYAHDAEEPKLGLDPKTTEILVRRDNPNELSVELTTPVLPTTFGTELLEEPEHFYLDQIGALVCAHLFSIDQMHSAASSSLGLIVPRLDIDDMAGQLRWIRKALPQGVIDERVLKLPSTGMRVSFCGDPERGYTFAIRSSYIILDFKEVLLEETEIAELAAPGTS